MPNQPTFKTSNRTGAVLAMVLASLLVASLLGLSLIETVLVHHRQMRVVGRQQQGFWLAEAGLQRALRGLAENADYAGETWEVSAETFGGVRPAVVAIEVVEAAESSGTRRVRAEARLPGASPGQDVFVREVAIPTLPESVDAGDGDENGQEQSGATPPSAESVARH